MLIDTHIHLNFRDYDNDLDDVIKRSIGSGVKKMICVSSNIADSIKSVKIARKYPGVVFAAVGMHPQCTDPENEDLIDIQLDKLNKIISENSDIVVAIGECGLDFTDVAEGERRRTLEEQEKIFKYQISLAQKYDLPILLHFNKSHDYFLENYNDVKKCKGIFHCYVGGRKRLKDFLEFDGFLFGVNGLLTYDEGLQNVVKEIPLERIAFETDGPFLAPGDYRGSRNEPGYIRIIADKLAELSKVGVDEISGQTTDNVLKIFNI